MKLVVFMYHYVRDLKNSQFPDIKGMPVDEFKTHVADLERRYEMATLDSALDFLKGAYHPQRDLCLLTFDDGLKDHFSNVLPILAEKKIQGLFFLITSCLENHRVVQVHMNHFLMARLGFAAYKNNVLAKLKALDLAFRPEVDNNSAQKTYRWDSPDVAAFKYFLNYCLGEEVRHRIMDELFKEVLGSEEAFSKKLYLSWEEAKQMQEAGMIMGGHTHHHVLLANLAAEQQKAELSLCQNHLSQRLHAQTYWPFSYPYGKNHSFNEATIDALKQLGVVCSFATEVGTNEARQDIYRIRRLDPKDVAGGWAK